MVANSGPTAFPDGELRKLKETAYFNDALSDDNEDSGLTWGQVKALIYRLEAAENVLKLGQMMLGQKVWDDRAWLEDVNAWRQASGK